MEGAERRRDVGPAELTAREISVVEVRSVRKVFARRPALAGVSFTLRGGRVTLMMGPNGAGKSTLLSILSTLSRPTEGEVLYGEHNHAHVERHLRGRIGLLSHESMLYRRMTCRENLLFFARLHRVPEPVRAVDRWLARLKLDGEAERPVGELSRGQVQRAALARVLLPGPDLLLLDEPFTGLDREAVELLRAEIVEASGSGRIVAVVSHDVDAVGGLCDHLLVLRRGRVGVEHEEPGLPRGRIQELYHAAL